MSKSIGYIRVSTKEQSTLRQLAGVQLDRDPYIDKVSGATRDRPALNECIAYLREGDTLHVHSVDRLGRNMRNTLEILETRLAKGVTVHFHKENLMIKIGSTDAFTQLQLQMFSICAEFERNIGKDRQQEGIAMAKEHGTRSGKPFGKQPLDMTRRNEAIEYSKQGMNISQIAKAMKLARGSIYKLLQ